MAEWDGLTRYGCAGCSIDFNIEDHDVIEWLNWHTPLCVTCAARRGGKVSQR